MEDYKSRVSEFVRRGNYHAAINIALSGLNACRRNADQQGVDEALAIIQSVVDELAREPDTVLATLGCLLKTSDDLEQVDNSQLDQLLSGHA